MANKKKLLIAGYKRTKALQQLAAINKIFLLCCPSHPKKTFSDSHLKVV